MTEKLMTVEEAADFLKVSTKTIQRAYLDKENPLRVARFGKKVFIPESALRDYLGLNEEVTA